MYVRVTYPKIQCFDNNGKPAAGYEIHTFLANLTTPTITHKDRLLTSPNTNPIVLNARGEADICTRIAIKLVFTIPGGNPASPIWTVDYVGEQQDAFISGEATATTLNNNYVVDVVPAVSALSNNLMLVMTPDVSNASTITSTTFTGTGINDLTVLGAYIGTTSGSQYLVEIDANGTPDTFKWKKDGGSWTTGVDILETEQTFQEGLSLKFAMSTGHTIGDYWTIEVETPASVNLCSLGAKNVYKNRGGSIVALDGSDMLDGYPAQLVMNKAMDGWLLVNPATPTFETPTISAVRYRRNVTTDYTQTTGDEGYELSCTGPLTVTLLTPPEFANRFFYIKNVGTGPVTVDAGASYVIHGGNNRYFSVGSGACVQLVTNGVDWHIIADVADTPPMLPPPLTWVSASSVKVAASTEYPISVVLAGFPNVMHPGTFINGVKGSIRTNTADATHTLWGSEKSSQWYAMFAISGSSGTFTVKGMPWMRVKSQATQTISLGTLVTPANGIGYGFTTDELIGYYAYFISGASKGMLRPITANNNDNTTGGTITYSGTALSVTAGDWFIVLPAANFRWLGDIFNNSSGDIYQFQYERRWFYYLEAVSFSPVSTSSGKVSEVKLLSPMADSIRFISALGVGNSSIVYGHPNGTTSTLPEVAIYNYAEFNCGSNIGTFICVGDVTDVDLIRTVGFTLPL